MLELAGRIADGVILNLMSPAQAGQAASLVRAAAVAAGREAIGRSRLCRARLPIRRPRCGRRGGSGGGAALRAAPRGGEAVRRTDLSAARERALAGDRAGAADFVPAPCRRCVRRARGTRLHSPTGRVPAGVDLPVVFPMPVSGDWGFERVIQALSAQRRPPADEETIMGKDLVVRLLHRARSRGHRDGARNLLPGRPDLAQRRPDRAVGGRQPQGAGRGCTGRCPGCATSDQAGGD